MVIAKDTKLLSSVEIFRQTSCKRTRTMRQQSELTGELKSEEGSMSPSGSSRCRPTELLSSSSTASTSAMSLPWFRVWLAIVAVTMSACSGTASSTSASFVRPRSVTRMAVSLRRHESESQRLIASDKLPVSAAQRTVSLYPKNKVGTSNHRQTSRSRFDGGRRTTRLPMAGATKTATSPFTSSPLINEDVLPHVENWASATVASTTVVGGPSNEPMNEDVVQLPPVLSMTTEAISESVLDEKRELEIEAFVPNAERQDQEDMQATTADDEETKRQQQAEHVSELLRMMDETQMSSIDVGSDEEFADPALLTAMTKFPTIEDPTKDVKGCISDESKSNPSSESAVASSDKQGSVEVPSYRKLTLFSAATMFIWLSEPLLSLVDTTVVGWTQRHAGKQAVLQLAAVGPATTLYDSLCYICYFLAMATTNVITKSQAERDVEGLQRNTSQILGVAALMGAAVSATLFWGGPSILASMATSSNGNVAGWLPLAIRYTRIRASVAGFAIVGFCLQALCLATLDTVTPAIAVMAAAVLNTVGDVVLAPMFGLQGVAAATAASTALSSFILYRAGRKQMKAWTLQRQEEQGSVGNADPSTQAVSSSKRTMNEQHQRIFQKLKSIPSKVRTTGKVIMDAGKTTLRARRASLAPAVAPSTTALAAKTGEEEASRRNQESRGGDIPMFSIPDSRSFIQLLRLSGPLFFVYLAKTVCYGAMTISCTGLGVVPLAAHSIMMRIFFFFACIGDSLSQTAQSFLPATLYPKPNPKAFKQIMLKLIVMATVMGASSKYAISWIFCNLSKYLTNDRSVVALMSNPGIVSFVGLAALLHPYIVSLEGTMVAGRNFRPLVMIYAATTIFHLTNLSVFSNSFNAMWRCFFFFQLARFVNFGFRVFKQNISSGRLDESVMASSQ